MIILDGNGIMLQSILSQPKDEICLEYSRNILLQNILKHKNMFGDKFLRKDENLVIAFDDYNYWRKDIYPYYKFSRKTKSEGTNWELVYDILHTIKDELRNNFPYICLQFDKTEADDIIACLTKHIEHKNKTSNIHTESEKVLIISNDKDFIQLLKFPNTSFFRPSLKVKEFYYSYNETDISKKYHNIKEQRVSPLELQYFLNEHIISGDISDGIPNILSDDDVFAVKEKRQKPMLTKFKEVWKTQIPEQFLTMETEANYIRNKKLIDFDEIPQTIYNTITSEYETQIKIKRKLNYKFFVENGLSKLLDSVGNF